MSAPDRLTRPPTPAGFDASRAAERAADPRGWRYDDDARDAVYRVLAERRDIRRFRPDPVPEGVLRRVLAAAHQAPSVGLMQPWRFIVAREEATRIAVRQIAQRERLRQADRFGPRASQFLDQKIEGVVEAPLGIVVCCDHGDPDAEVLGRGTIPETDVYSTACAIENLWLAARAEGLGVGWVSFYRPDDLRALFGIPARVDPMAYLCLGWPDERPVRPGLEAAGWSERAPLEDVVMEERWAAGPTPDARRPTPGPDRAAAASARDRLDALVKPAGSLGALEPLIERWAAIAGAPPPARIRAGVLVCAADHGHVAHGTSLFDADVSAQVAAAAARGETAAGVLARRGDHVLLVADVGLRGPTPDGVRDAKVAEGTADMLRRPGPDAPSRSRRRCAPAPPWRRSCARTGVDCLVLGEIGIGNTTTTAALVCALTGAPPERTVGRGTGLDAAGPGAQAGSGAEGTRTPQRPTPKRPTPNARRPTPDARRPTPDRPTPDARRPASRRRPRARRPRRRGRRGGPPPGAGAPRRLRDRRRRARRHPPRPGRRRGADRLATARPSPATRSCSTQLGLEPSSTCACGSARPAAPCSRCR